MDPEKSFIHWFNLLPGWQKKTLSRLFILMTSSHSGDFALSGSESLQKFLSPFDSADFPIRRIARLLSIRAVFNFIYLDIDFAQQFVLQKGSDAVGEMVDISGYQWLRDAKSWHRLSETVLSDVALHQWLRRLESSSF